MTEVELGEDIISSLKGIGVVEEKEGHDHYQTKFDAKGTLHLISRNAEGAMIYDSPVITTPTTGKEKKEDAILSFSDEHEVNQKLLKRAERQESIMKYSLIAVTCLWVCGLIIWRYLCP